MPRDAATPADEPPGRDQYDLWIDGHATPATSGEMIPTENPATEEQIATVAAAEDEDVDRAVENARAALPEWRDVPPAERGRLLGELADALRAEKDRLAHVEMLDVGKPRSQAETSVESCARYFEYYAGIADKVHGDSIPVGREYVDYTIREPLGVTVQILPWNFPISLVGRSVAPALATGNVAIAKPAEQTPLTALLVGELASEVGFPDGVFNVVTGYGADAGAALSGHTDVDGVSFTGSVSTGQAVAKQAADSVTPVHLELGGKSPNAVFPDADVENAIEQTIAAIFGKNAGQVCSAGSRLLVHEDVHDEFVDRLAEAIRDLTVGPGDEDPDVGPLVSREQYEKVQKYIEIGRTEVDDPVVGGETLDRPGYFVEPTLFDGVENDMRIAQEEIFGPVLGVIEFANEAEAIDIANDVRYGLTAGIFTSDLGRAHRYAREVRAGQIYINEWFSGGVGAPFGGFKDSGYGREKGLEAIESYTETKNVCARIDL